MRTDTSRSRVSSMRSLGSFAATNSHARRRRDLSDSCCEAHWNDETQQKLSRRISANRRWSGGDREHFTAALSSFHFCHEFDILLCNRSAYFDHQHYWAHGANFKIMRNNALFASRTSMRKLSTKEKAKDEDGGQDEKLTDLGEEPIASSSSVVIEVETSTTEEKVLGKEQSQSSSLKRRKIARISPESGGDVESSFSDQPFSDIPPLQTRRNAEMLFDSIAPHLDYKTMRALSDQMNKFAKEATSSHESSPTKRRRDRPNQRKNPPQKQKQQKSSSLTLIGRINDYFGTMQKAGTSDIEVNPWLKPLLVQFFAGGTIIPHLPQQPNYMPSTSHPAVFSDDADTAESAYSLESRPVPKLDFNTAATPDSNTKIASPSWSDPTFTPNVNRKHFEKHVDTLMKARDVSAQYPLWWSDKQRKKHRRLIKQRQRAAAAAAAVTGTLAEDSANEEDEKVGSEIDLKPVHSEKKKDEIIGERNAAKEDAEEDEDNEVDDSSNELSTFLRSGENIQRSALLTSIHQSKSETTRRLEAEAMASLLADRLPSKCHDALIELLETHAKSGINETQIGHPPGRMVLLYPNVKNKVKFHVHLVAPDLASFFYVDVPDDDASLSSMKTSSSGSPSGVDQTATPVPTATNSAATGDGSNVTKPTDGSGGFRALAGSDPRINEAWRDWNAARDDIVRSFLESQRMYVEGMKQGGGDKGNEAKEEKKSSGTTLREQMTETIEKLDRLRTRPSDGVKIGRDRRQSSEQARGRRKKVHLVFDAILLNDEWAMPLDTSLDVDNDTLSREKDDGSKIVDGKVQRLPPVDRTIFIDNLPIDIDEEELFDLYSRCGPVESVQIYNLRPDLDPGELSGKQRADLRRKTRYSMSNRPPGSQERKRTPVYGIVTFATDEGYEVATEASLRIFGMVIRRHPVRSIEARDMKRLYVENIPPGFYSLDIEYKLSRVLHPDIYVCLDIGHHDFSEPSSCEIKFPTFEMAYHSFVKLQQVDMGSDECVLNWMKMPQNAMGYWTREVGFDD